MVKILGFEPNLRPRDWGHAWRLALVNTGRGLAEMFSNKRLWIGMAVSALLHALIVMFALGLFTGTKIEESDATLTEVTSYDESLPPKAQQIVQREQQFLTSPTGLEEAAPIDLSAGKFTSQAKMSVDNFSLDKSQASFSGDVIRINPNAKVSTEEILSQAPINLARGTGGVGNVSPFEKIAATGGSIELNEGATQLGSEAIKKPTLVAQETNGGDAAQAAGSQKSGYSLSGDLASSDIVGSVMPAYPPWARQKGLSNVTVSIQFSADAAGNVSPTMIVIKSTGYPDWDAQVKSTLGRWKFKPSENGIAKRVAVITFRFILT